MKGCSNWHVNFKHLGWKSSFILLIEKEKYALYISLCNEIGVLIRPRWIEEYIGGENYTIFKKNIAIGNNL